MTINKQALVIIDTTNKSNNNEIDTIYQLDVLIELSNTKKVTIKEPSTALLEQIQSLRPNYLISFIIY